jgi:microcompartment protein CcmL/EutN
MKPFVISKSKAKALKAGRVYLVDLRASTTGYVYSVIVRGELALKKGK